MPEKSRNHRRRIGGSGAAALLAGCTLALGLLAGARPAHAVNPETEMGCLAKAIYFESRGEPRGGMVAVGHVVLNRSRDPHFPHGICAVVNQRARGACQFSYACDGRSDQPKDRAMWAESLTLARAIYSGHSVDPTRGALWFHRASVTPSWRHDYRRTARIGSHIFYAAKQDAI